MEAEIHSGRGRVRIRLSDEVVALLSKPAIPLATAGRLFFGLSPAATRAAAEKGDLPLIRVGKKMFCPTVPLRRMLHLDDPEVSELPDRTAA